MSQSPAARSPLALAAIATAAIPGLDVVATRPPRTPGADFDVAGLMDSAGQRWMIRAPKGPAAGAALEGEVGLLEALARAADAALISFDVPRPEGFAHLPEGGRAMVYRELLGRPLPLASLAGGNGLAAQVGRAIASLHELPSSVVSDAGLPQYDAEAYRLRRLAEVDDAARTGHVPPGLLRRWEHALEDVRLWRFRATPVHGDLTAEHVLVADDDVVAIIDWSDARVADPADDLAWLLASAPEESLDAILEAYALARTERSDEHLAARALLASELAVARWLLHGVRNRDGDVIDDAVQMLLELDAAVADEPPIGYAEPVIADVHRADDGADAHVADGEWPAGDLAEEDQPVGDQPVGDQPAGDDPREDEPDDDPAMAEPAGLDDDEPAAGAAEAIEDSAESEWLEPDYRRTRPARGHDDTPTMEFPPARG